MINPKHKEGGIMIARSIRRNLLQFAGSPMLALIAAVFGYATPANAATAHVTGVVSDLNGIGVANSSVSAVPLDGGIPSGPVPTSPTDGSYDITVDTGISGHTYDFYFLTPQGSGIAEVVAINVFVTGDQFLNVT